jgi:cellulose synthase/poly-beta-1,6-N-acetylglucosamine synthase-like glycosyltransferase
MVRHFADRSVGVVSGDVQLVDSADSYAASEGLYYRYERAIQELESRIGSIIGADGGMYALRRELFQPPSEAIVVDDFVVSMNVARLGYRVVYEPKAIAVERGTSSGAEEFRRKVRIVAGGVQALLRQEGVPRIGQPVLLWSYISHKLLRWLIPVFLIVLFVTSAALSGEHLYALALVVQVAGYLTALAYPVLPAFTRSIPGASVAFYFCLVNLAAISGIWRGLGHSQTAIWARTNR